MPLMLRKIRQARWYKHAFSWLAPGEIPADPIADLQTAENKLSVWHINEDHSNLQDVIVAIAACRDVAANFDYALFDEQVCSELNIEIENTVGNTPNNEVNQKWHRHLVKLSADKLLKLAKVIYEKGETKRIREKEIPKMIAGASLAGRIPIKSIKPNLQRKVITTPLWKTSSSS